MTNEQMRVELPAKGYRVTTKLGTHVAFNGGPEVRKGDIFYTAEQVTAAILADRERRAAKDAGAGDTGLRWLPWNGGPTHYEQILLWFKQYSEAILVDRAEDGTWVHRDGSNALKYWTPTHYAEIAPPAPSPTDDHPPSRHCGCAECAPSFEADPPAPAAPVSGAVRKAFEQAMKQSWQMADPLKPPAPGSYYMGEHNGIIAALRTVRANFDDALAATQQAEPSNPWLPHNGGPCPVAPNVLVDVKFRDGTIKPRVRARLCDWRHLDFPDPACLDDIIEYRLHREGGE